MGKEEISEHPVTDENSSIDEPFSSEYLNRPWRDGVQRIGNDGTGRGDREHLVEKIQLVERKNFPLCFNSAFL